MLGLSQGDIDEYKSRKRYHHMRDVIDLYDDKRSLLSEFENLQLTGMMCAIPPILGALTQIGYFEDNEILYWAISYLRGYLGLPQ
jgi:hypothetical protein